VATALSSKVMVITGGGMVGHEEAGL